MTDFYARCDYCDKITLVGRAYIMGNLTIDTECSICHKGTIQELRRFGNSVIDETALSNEREEF